MGYETTLYFVNTYDRKVGFWDIVGSVELHKVAYNQFEKLINGAKIRQNKNKKIDEILTELNDIRNDRQKIEEIIFWEMKKRQSLTITEEKLGNKELKLRRMAEKLLPFIFEGDIEKFEDQYGDKLLVADLNEVEDALEKDNAKDILDGEESYEPFRVALAMIREFKGNKRIKIVMWGH